MLNPKTNKPIKLLVVSQYFYPEQFRVNDMCVEWVKRGYDVTVVTGIPNYPQGKFFKGFGLFKRRRETYYGVRIIRLPIISRGRSKFRLILNYISFVVSGFIWNVFSRLKADCVFIHEISPMTQSLVGVWFGKRRDIPVIHYVTDLWPENVVAVSGIKSARIIRMIGGMVDYIYRNNEKILTSSRRFIPAILSRGVDERKIHFWPHYAEEFYQPKQRNEDFDAAGLIPSSKTCLNIAFTGNLGEAQGLHILPTTALLLKERSTDFCFNMIGEGRGKDELLRLVKQEGVEDCFRFIPRQNADQIPYFLAQCDAGLVMLSNNPVFELYLPTKVQSYLACGIPIIASGKGEMCDVVMEAKAGCCAKTGDAESLADVIERLSKHNDQERETLRNNALEYFQANFHKSKLMDQMDEYLKNTIKEYKN